MDKLINNHIDNIDTLENELKEIIEREISQINIDEVMINPSEVLTQVVENIKAIFLSEYSEKAMLLGFDFGQQINKRIEQEKMIKVDDSKDAKLNG